MESDSSQSTGVTSDVIDTLERVVRSLGDELAFFRRRALDAERRVRDVLSQQASAGASVTASSVAVPTARMVEADRARIAVLEAENAELRARIVDATERARAVASRMRFARQQDEAAGVTEGAA